MNCYFCVQHRSRLGRTNYDIHTAIGICKHCGVGVCEEHGQKRVDPGEPLLCLSCAELLASDNVQKQGVGSRE